MVRGGRTRSVAGRVLVGLALSFALVTAAGAETVSTLEIDGVISPVPLRLSRERDRARPGRARRRAGHPARHARWPRAVDARDRPAAAELAEIPVIVYVSPTGARAASAGVFITIAAHVAAMAPATNIGAAHPVPAAAAPSTRTVHAKIENDAAAFIRTVALERGRNADWAEKAVRSSVSITEHEAVQLGSSTWSRLVPDLLEKVDGRR